MPNSAGRPSKKLTMKNNIGPLYRMLAAAVFAVTPVAQAQVQTTGTPSSPSATTTIPGNQLPAPPEPFGGVIKETAKDSTPYWPATIVPPNGAPNLPLIMTDDQGSSVSGTFRGVIPPPPIDHVPAAALPCTPLDSPP